jgi:branched-chain amino acid transport system permease protein
VGGAGTLFASLLGALVIKTLGEATKLLTSDAPGLDLAIYGLVLIAVVGSAPRGIAGLLNAFFRWPFRAVAQPEGGNG